MAKPPQEPGKGINISPLILLVVTDVSMSITCELDLAYNLAVRRLWVTCGILFFAV